MFYCALRSRLSRLLFGEPDELRRVFGADGRMRRYDERAAFERYHSEPARHVWARELRRRCRRLGRSLHGLVDPRLIGGAAWTFGYRLREERWALATEWVRSRLIKRYLERSRVLYYRSFYVQPGAATRSVEGFFVTPYGYYGLDIVTPAHLEEEASSEWAGGEIAWLEPGRTLVCPGERLTAELIQEALERWYMQRYAWCRRHWAVRARRLPEIRVELSFEEPETEVEAESERSRAVFAAYYDKRRRLLFERFDRGPEPGPRPLYDLSLRREL